MNAGRRALWSLAVAMAMVACDSAREGEARPAQPPEPGEVRTPIVDPASATLDTIPGTNWTERDWAILVEKVEWAADRGLDTVSLGTAMAELGRTFVGATYTPGTLEAPGDEHLVINLRELDCVTFIETVWALNRFLRSEGTTALGDPAAARAAYEAHLRAIRYRDGMLAGYPSRLHYFSDWLWNHEDRGDLELVTASLGGVPDPEPIDFMSTHPDAYRQLAAPAVLQAIRDREEHLNSRGPRIYLPQPAIAAVEEGILDGDIIAATSTVSGLDIAHTGIALHIEGRLHLLHAPLVGRNVEISELPLGDRIAGISGQDGIVVARLTEGD